MPAARRPRQSGTLQSRAKTVSSLTPGVCRPSQQPGSRRVTIGLQAALLLKDIYKHMQISQSRDPSIGLTPGIEVIFTLGVNGMSHTLTRGRAARTDDILRSPGTSQQLPGTRAWHDIAKRGQRLREPTFRALSGLLVLTRYRDTSDARIYERRDDAVVARACSHLGSAPVRSGLQFGERFRLRSKRRLHQQHHHTASTSSRRWPHRSRRRLVDAPPTPSPVPTLTNTQEGANMGGGVIDPGG